MWENKLSFDDHVDSLSNATFLLKLSKAVGVGLYQSYSVRRQCRFLGHSVVPTNLPPKQHLDRLIRFR